MLNSKLLCQFQNLHDSIGHLATSLVSNLFFDY